MGVTLRAKNVDALVNRLRRVVPARPTIRVGLKISGPAAAYFLVWEWGRVDINPGPKTLWSTNADGEHVVLTLQAPHGYIRVNRSKFRQVIREEFHRINWKKIKKAEIEANVRLMLRRANRRIKEIIVQAAPIDTGQLREAIQDAVDVDNPQQGSDSLAVRARLKV